MRDRERKRVPDHRSNVLKGCYENDGWLVRRHCIHSHFGLAMRHWFTLWTCHEALVHTLDLP